MAIHYDPAVLFADHFQYVVGKSEFEKEIDEIKKKEEEKI